VVTGALGLLCYATTGFARLNNALLIAFCLILGLRKQSIEPPDWLCVIAGFAGMLAAASRWHAGMPFITALSGFTSLMLVIQLASMKTRRAVKLALLLAGMLVLSAAAMNINFVLPLAFFPFVTSLLMALERLEWCEAHEQAGHVQASLRERDCGGGAAGPAYWLRCGLAGAVVWVILFYLFPRPDVFGISAGRTSDRLRGFSETLRLGESGFLADNPQVVMRVRPVVEGTVPGWLVNRLRSTLIRGCSFRSYQNGNWSREGYRGRSIFLDQQGGQLKFRDFGSDQRPTLMLEILLENIDPPVLFVPDQCSTLFTSLARVWGETDGSIFMIGRRGGIEVYQAEVKQGEVNLEEVTASASEIPPSLGSFIDPGDSSLAIADLALETASGTIGILERVAAVETFLRNTCSYSLEGDEAGIRDPVSHFIFNSRSGTCEHFASAMVIMLRYLGIPARPVNGYMLSEWNETGGFFTVRQRDAHTWVEVFLPPLGWTAFDPTPPDRAEAGAVEMAGAGLLAGVWNRFEGIWFNYVYRFDKNAQMAGFRRLQQQWQQRFIRGKVVFGSLFGTALFLVGITCIWLILRSRRRPLAGDAEKRVWIPTWYKDSESLWSLSRHPWETPSEFHRRLLCEGVLQKDAESLILELDECLRRSCFSDDPPSCEAGKRILRQLQNKKRARDMSVPG